MLAAFQKFIAQEKLISDHDRVLLAVSGGIDSMVMTELFSRTGINFGIAHCNFQLRGKDSDADESFVKSVAENTGGDFFSKRFETQEVAKKRGISVQMAARELRREWLSEILHRTDYSCYATAHHLDDQNETFFINLIRGSGIRGLHGILPKQGCSIHPMLFAWRRDIEKYAQERTLTFREDRTNKQTDYLRNKIRHKIMPLLLEMNSAFAHSLKETILRLRSTEKIYQDQLKRSWAQIADTSRGSIQINGQEILKLEEKQTYLFEFLMPYGFSSADVSQILKILPYGSGQHFYSPSHRLILDRKSIIITDKQEEDDMISTRFFVAEDDRSIAHPVPLEISIKNKGPQFQINLSPKVAQLNAGMLRFPLMIRKWHNGDRFIPLGMKGTKLISDFFIDEKFSQIDKENCWLLLSGHEVVWIIGYRIDDRYKVTATTTHVLEITMTDHRMDTLSGKNG